MIPEEQLSNCSRPLLTVVIPVFNEEHTVAEVLRLVIDAPYSKQILVVDDGSTDRTAEILQQCEIEMPIRVDRRPANRGKGAAIRMALDNAIGRFTIIQDADLEVHPREYPKFVEPLIDGEADFVIGSRFSVGSSSPVMRTGFQAGIWLLNSCVRVWYGVHLTDEACCYKALRTETLKSMNLTCERFEFCPEVVAKACLMGLRIKEVPIAYDPRNTAAGKKIRYRDGVDAIKTLWKWRKWMPDGLEQESVESR